MKQHTSVENTPMRFHKFFTYALIPLSIALSIYYSINLLATSPQFDIYTGADLAYYIICFVFLCVILHHLFEYNPKTFKVLLAYYAFLIIYVLAVMIFYSVVLPEEMPSLVGQLLGNILWGAIYCTYYYKRIPVFEDITKQDAMPEEIIFIDEDGTIVIEQPTQKPKPKRKLKKKKVLKLLIGVSAIFLLIFAVFTSVNSIEQDRSKRVYCSDYTGYYHDASCEDAKRLYGSIEKGLAENRGYEPCPKCKP